jgi:hypothetical protein
MERQTLARCLAAHARPHAVTRGRGAWQRRFPLTPAQPPSRAPPRALPRRPAASPPLRGRRQPGAHPDGPRRGAQRLALRQRARHRFPRAETSLPARGKGGRFILGRRAGRVLRALRGRQAARAGGCAGPVGAERGGGQHRRGRGGRAARAGARRDRRARSRPWTASLHAHDPPQRARRRACIGRGRRWGAGRGARGAGRTGRGGVQGWRRSPCRGGGTRAPRAP